MFLLSNIFVLNRSKHTNWAHIQRESWKHYAMIWSPFRRFKLQEFELLYYQPESQTKTIYDEVITRNKIPVKKVKQTRSKRRMNPKQLQENERLAVCTSKLREDLNREKTFSFGHCPNHLNPPPHDPNSGNLVLFFRKSKYKIWKSV